MFRGRALVSQGAALIELGVPQGLGLGVVLATLGQGQFVVPDLLCGAVTLEEKQVGGDAGIGSKDAVGQADNRVMASSPISILQTRRNMLRYSRLHFTSRVESQYRLPPVLG